MSIDKLVDVIECVEVYVFYNFNGGIYWIRFDSEVNVKIVIVASHLQMIQHYYDPQVKCSIIYLFTLLTVAVVAVVIVFIDVDCCLC